MKQKNLAFFVTRYGNCPYFTTNTKYQEALISRVPQSPLTKSALGPPTK